MPCPWNLWRWVNSANYFPISDIGMSCLVKFEWVVLSAPFSRLVDHQRLKIEWPRCELRIDLNEKPVLLVWSVIHSSWPSRSGGNSVHMGGWGIYCGHARRVTVHEGATAVGACPSAKLRKSFCQVIGIVKFAWDQHSVWAAVACVPH